MLNLVLPAESGLDAYEDLVARRRDEDARRAFRAAALRAALRKAYDAYNSTTPGFDRSFAEASISVAHVTLLKELYTRYRQHLRDAVERAQPRASPALAHCQLCGIGEPGTLDHYLSKSEYPEFYVFPPNLVPSCSNCNSPRATFDGAGRRRIVHLFADDVTAVPSMVACAVAMKRGQPTAGFDLVSSATGPAAGLFRRHWEALNLRVRYERQAPSKLETIRAQNVSMVQRFAMTAASFASTLQDMAAGLERVHGLNHWEAALHRGAAESKAFLAYCGAL